MKQGEILVDLRDRVLFCVINRPHKRNALSRALLGSLKEVFADAAKDMSLIAAVIRGAGDKSFAAGGDLNDLSSVRTEEEATKMALDARDCIDAVRRFPVPVLAALNGDALGGGAELAAGCDFRVAAAHARIGFIQGRLAISTAWGGGPDLVRIVGATRALYLLASADIVDAERAVRLGLYDRVAELGRDVDDAVESFLNPMRRQTPQVMRAFKAVVKASGGDRDAAESVEVERFAACWAHPDHWAAHGRVLVRKGDS